MKIRNTIFSVLLFLFIFASKIQASSLTVSGSSTIAPNSTGSITVTITNTSDSPIQDQLGINYGLVDAFPIRLTGYSASYSGGKTESGELQLASPYLSAAPLSSPLNPGETVRVTFYLESDASGAITFGIQPFGTIPGTSKTVTIATAPAATQLPAPVIPDVPDDTNSGEGVDTETDTTSDTIVDYHDQDVNSGQATAKLVVVRPNLFHKILNFFKSWFKSN